MRAAILVIVLLAVGSNAFLFDSFGEQFNQLKQAGSQLVGGLVAKGKEVLGSLLGKAAEALKGISGKIGGTATAADATTKRDLKDFFSKLAAFRKNLMDKLDDHKKGSTGLFSKALDNLKQRWIALKNKVAKGDKDMKDAVEFNKGVDAVVDKHGKDQKRFFIDTVKSAASAVGSALTSDTAKAIAGAAAKAALTAAAGSVGKRFFIDTVKSVASTVGKIASNPIVQAVGKAALTAALTKRSTISELLEKCKLPVNRSILDSAKCAAASIKFAQTNDTAKALAEAAAKAGHAALTAALTKRSTLSEFLKKWKQQQGQTPISIFRPAIINRRFFIDTVKSALKSDTAKAIAGAAAKAALTAAAGSVGKRSILSDIGNFFAPHVSALTDTVKKVGSTLKDHATNLWNTIKGHVATLGQKLAPHVDTLKKHAQTVLQHGKNAFDALKGAVGDILSQTLTNAKPALAGLAKAGTDAVGTVANHVSGAIAGTSA